MKQLLLRKSKLTPEEIKTQYVVGLRTMQEIADTAGVSKQAIKLVLDRMGVEYRGGKIDKQCLFCGEMFKARRAITKRGRGNYCSTVCFHASHSTCGEYSANGGAMARVDKALRDQSPAMDKKMSREALETVHATGIRLLPEQVIHHIDGDRTNNNPDNLMIFHSQSAHMQHHHAQRRKV